MFLTIKGVFLGPMLFSIFRNNQAGKDEDQLQRTAGGLKETDCTSKRRMKMDFNTYYK